MLKHLRAVRAEEQTCSTFPPRKVGQAAGKSCNERAAGKAEAAIDLMQCVCVCVCVTPCLHPIPAQARFALAVPTRLSKRFPARGWWAHVLAPLLNE